MMRWAIRAARVGDPRAAGTPALLVHKPPAWTMRAACTQTDPDLWFPEGKGGHSIPTTRLAKRICATCPVRRECLDYALDYETRVHGTESSYPSGIYGGLTARERSALRKERREAS